MPIVIDLTQASSGKLKKEPSTSMNYCIDLQGVFEVCVERVAHLQDGGGPNEA